MQQDSFGYDHETVERRWQRRWAEADVFRTPDSADDPEYVLAMFPYPSGEMHMGHVRNYAITDAYARFRRMQGETVLHPMGWDSFGLPAENAANRRSVDPREWTMDCIDDIREQMKLMGLGFDWEREVTTCEPEYYRWNQWLFLRFYEAGLVERGTAELNWCPDCETVLADENVDAEDGTEVCWRCDAPIEQRDLEQWFLTTTDYADELYDALDELDGWPENVREMQRNWIGKQEGASVEFELTTGDSVEIFTTRLDTIYGATFFALSPGHEVAQRIAAENEEVAEYVDRVEGAPDDEVDETSGVFTGEHAVNPTTGEEIPVYVADYVLEDVGTGALYAVPAHDERDHAFAEAHGVEVRQVVEPAPDADVDPEDVDVRAAAYTEDGVLVNSGEFDGLTSERAREEFLEVLDGERRTEHGLRDWCISRQRYWGTPIPMVDCPDCGYVPVREEALPVELPGFVRTTGNPLDAAEEWKRTTCPDCGGPAERETDTMDTFVDSSWYFLRYVSPDLGDAPFDIERASDWLPVDRYVGGIEHATMHLIYARFFTKALADLDLVDVREPFENLLTQGMVLDDGEAMSSSTGNVVTPRSFVTDYGADTARLFMLEAARPEKDFEWTEEGVRSTRRFLDRLHRLVDSFAAGEVDTTDERGAEAAYVAREIDAVVDTATDSYDELTFVEGVRAARELVRLLDRYRTATTPHRDTYRRGLVVATKALAPVVPHLAEELWTELGGEGLVATADWPSVADPSADHEAARRLIERTREDVRDIVDVADVDPAEIVVTVAPTWMHRIRERAREAADAGADVVPAVMRDETLRAAGDDVAGYAKELAGEARSLGELLPPGQAADVLEGAAWLFAAEFDAEVRVERPEEAPRERLADARPGRPGIDIREAT